MNSNIARHSGKTNRRSVFLSALVITFVSGALLFLSSANDDTLKKLQSGEYKLECMFSDGWRDIQKDKIVGIDDEKGYFLFTNGYARTCKITK